MKSESIHPRVSFSNGQKKNTCKPQSKAKLLLAKKGIELHIATNPRDSAAKTRLANLNKRLEN